MTTNYPTSLDDAAILASSYTDGTPTQTEHKTTHNNLADAIIAVETEVGALAKGSFASVVARLSDMVYKAPTAAQTIQPSGDFLALGIRAFAGQTAAILELRAANDALLGSIDKDGAMDAVSYRVGGAALASTALSDTANILRETSPTITTPSMSSPALSGVPAAPTQAAGNDSTLVATTAHVVSQGFAKLASPAFSGSPTAPTQAPGNDSTRVATTAYTQAAIAAAPPTPVPPGLVMAYGGAAAPSGWLLCDGTAVSQATYAALYAICGVSYGNPGGGNFNLPDFRGRFAVGIGTHVDVDALGDSDGIAVATRRPKHAHTTSFGLTAAGGHSHSGGTSGGGGSHSHAYTGAGSQGFEWGASSTVGGDPSGVGTGSGGSHTHGYQSDYSGSHTHDGGMGGTAGVAGMTESGGYLAVNYIVKT